ncbi:hypothetical protein DDZ14_00705 [Maritimibacter sp. 55A14]|uniref:hypothetical protein n=1 Tax=Maritimibacter sp. 55A14 TaxID=2174844 RepID=UPI000D6198F2|nr:hypothetical protein [Maritimibacter sp. 55A14]PWE34265.1 hypothetical protein DDZ14_00705 [Maritimibacter sp. 55A14]
MKAVTAALSILLLVSACATIRESRLNPVNWFGRSVETRQPARGQDAQLIAAAETEAARPIGADGRPIRPALRHDIGDYRILVTEITDLDVIRVPGGAIVQATGRPRRQGYWDADLVMARLSDQTEERLVLELRVFPPVAARPAGSAPSREVVVARHLSAKVLDGVREIVVVGQMNRMSSRR